MKIIYIKLLLLILITLSSCKRTRVCYCDSSTAEYLPIPVYGTKKTAQAKCKAYETNGKLDYYPEYGCKIIN